ncbi:hypothetical protein ATANTOWER_004098, partial [Ataeniobius toweri]|nr:hypothetical protein [Ataeniobius toweri]
THARSGCLLAQRGRGRRRQVKANGEKPRGKRGEKKQDEGKRRNESCLSAYSTLRQGRATVRARETCKSLSVRKEPEEQHDALILLFLNQTRRVRRRNRRWGGGAEGIP